MSKEPDMETSNYETLKNEVITILSKGKVATLATASNDRVTARAMAYASDGLKIYFQTDQSFLKVNQIRENPCVAVCLGNLSIEATATLKGHPFNNENKDFLRAFGQKNPGCIDVFTHIKSVVVIEAEAQFCTLWKGTEGKSFRDFLDLRNKTANREYYNN